jgi:hypothetical protein
MTGLTAAAASHGTDHRDGINLDRQHGSALSDWVGHDAIGAYSSIARHAANDAGSGQMGVNRGRASRGRAGQAFALVESEVVDRATANFWLRTATGHKRVDQAGKTKPPTGSCSRIVDQSLEPTRARCSRKRLLGSPGGCRACSRAAVALTACGNTLCHPAPKMRAPDSLSAGCRFESYGGTSESRRIWCRAGNGTGEGVPHTAGVVGNRRSHVYHKPACRGAASTAE